MKYLKHLLVFTILCLGFVKPDDDDEDCKDKDPDDCDDDDYDDDDCKCFFRNKNTSFSKTLDPLRAKLLASGEIATSFIEGAGYLAFNYVPTASNADIFISIAPKNFTHNNTPHVYVYTDPTQFEYDNEENTAKGHVWSNINENEEAATGFNPNLITIRANDSHYVQGGNYSIVVMQEKGQKGLFTISATEGTNQINFEGSKSHGSRLTPHQQSQEYVQNLTNDKNVYLDVQVNSGQAEVTISINGKTFTKQVRRVRNFLNETRQYIEILASEIQNVCGLRRSFEHIIPDALSSNFVEPKAVRGRRFLRGEYKRRSLTTNQNTATNNTQPAQAPVTNTTQPNPSPVPVTNNTQPIPDSIPSSNKSQPIQAPVTNNTQPTPSPVNVNNRTQPVNNRTQPVNNRTQPINNRTQPVNNKTQPVNNRTQPINNKTQPVNNRTQPINNRTHPTNRTIPTNTTNTTTPCSMKVVVLNNSTGHTEYNIRFKTFNIEPAQLLPGIQVGAQHFNKQHKYLFTSFNKNSEALLFIRPHVGSNIRAFAKFVNEPHQFFAKDITNRTVEPTPTNYDFASQPFGLTGQVLSVNYNNIPMNRTTRCITIGSNTTAPMTRCKLVIGVTGNHLLPLKNIKYDFAFYDSEVSRVALSRGVATNSTIVNGFPKFFTFEVNQTTQAILISIESLNNTADFVVARGAGLPLRGLGIDSTFGEINKKVFIKREKLGRVARDISGTYTLGVYSDVNTSFNIFYSTIDHTVQPAPLGRPFTCNTTQANQTCYFRLSEFEEEGYYNHQDMNLVLTSQILYGTADIYTKFYDESNHRSLVELPSATFNCHQSLNIPPFNIHRITYPMNDTRLNTSDHIVAAVKCHTPCFVTLKAAQNNSTEEIKLVPNVENLVFSKGLNSKSVVSFANNFNVQRYGYLVRRYSGNALLNAYIVKQVPGVIQGQLVSQREYILTNVNITGQNNTHVALLNDTRIANQEIFFEFVSTEPEFLASFKIFENTTRWDEVPVNTNTEIVLDKNGYAYAYVKLDSLFSGVTLNIKSFDQQGNSSIEIYGSYQNRDPNLPVNVDLDYPTPNNNYFMKTIAHLNNKTSIKLPWVNIYNPKEHGNSSVFLFKIRYSDLGHWFNKLVVSAVPTYLQDLREENFHSVLNNQLVKSTLSNQRVVEYFQALKRNVNSKLNATGGIIEYSSCLGNISIQISKDQRFVNFHHEYTTTNRFGRTIVHIPNLPTENLYFKVVGETPVEPTENCAFNLETNQRECTKQAPLPQTDYLVKFQSAVAENLKQIDQNGAIQWAFNKGNLNLKWPKILDHLPNIHNSTYYVYLTQNPELFKHFGSVCFLKNLIPAVTINNENNQNERREVTINSLGDQKYYVNIAAKIDDELELLAYTPIEVSHDHNKVPVSTLVVISLAILLAVLAMVYYYRRRKARNTPLFNDTREVPNTEELVERDSNILGF